MQGKNREVCAVYELYMSNTTGLANQPVFNAAGPTRSSL
jgi:hypothetical protein